MGEHRTPHGEKSDYERNGGKRNPNHTAKHRAVTAVEALIDTHSGTPAGKRIPEATIGSRLRLRKKK